MAMVNYARVTVISVYANSILSFCLPLFICIIIYNLYIYSRKLKVRMPRRATKKNPLKVRMPHHNCLKKSTKILPFSPYYAGKCGYIVLKNCLIKFASLLCRGHQTFIFCRVRMPPQQMPPTHLNSI